MSAKRIACCRKRTNSVRVELDLDPTLPRIKADRTRLAEAIALLGTAAARTANEDSALRIATSRNTSHVTVRIAPFVAGAH